MPTLRTSDGVPIDAWHDAGPGGLAVVVAHGFTGSWRRPAVRRIATRLAELGGAISLDLRGHGRSGGHSTVGDLEVLDVEAAVAWARDLGYTRIATVGFSPPLPKKAKCSERLSCHRSDSGGTARATGADTLIAIAAARAVTAR